MARTGLSAAHDVLAANNERNGLGLDRGGFGVAFVEHCPQ
jgi:hypothetical protein